MYIFFFISIISPALLHNLHNSAVKHSFSLYFFSLSYIAHDVQNYFPRLCGMSISEFLMSFFFCLFAVQLSRNGTVLSVYVHIFILFEWSHIYNICLMRTKDNFSMNGQ